MYLIQYPFHYKDLECRVFDQHRLHWINTKGKYEFQIENKKKYTDTLLELSYTKEVEQHLTEINYLGI